MFETLIDYLDDWVAKHPEKTWLIDSNNGVDTQWSWCKARDHIRALAAWLEEHLGVSGERVGIISKNCAHWVIADLAAISSGSAVVPLFTTLNRDVAKYIIDFTDIKVLFVGEGDHCEGLLEIVPEQVLIVTFPGVTLDREHVTIESIFSTYQNRRPLYQCKRSDLISIIFTSGTTGNPKGVEQNHDSFLYPVRRLLKAFELREEGRYFSYLPLAHVAERQMVECGALVSGGVIYFNESLGSLPQELAQFKPNFLFGPPRIWERLYHFVIDEFGSQAAIDEALSANKQAAIAQIKNMLGLSDVDYLLTGAAPIRTSLINWYEQLNLPLMEGYGQTEALGITANRRQSKKIGSIGQALDDVEIQIAADGELMARAPGAAVGYYNNPVDTGRTFVHGWVHTGDKARIDPDGFVYLLGRMKDYFKTSQGKYVSPAPIEEAFSNDDLIDHVCLIGRGYPKTVAVCSLNPASQQMNPDQLESYLRELAGEINKKIERHARVGSVVVSGEIWNIESGILTPTLKVKRDEIERRYGDLAQESAYRSAKEGTIQVLWA